MYLDLIKYLIYIKFESVIN